MPHERSVTQKRVTEILVYITFNVLICAMILIQRSRQVPPPVELACSLTLFIQKADITYWCLTIVHHRSHMSVGDETGLSLLHCIATNVLLEIFQSSCCTANKS